jgi:hypothetical protein
MKTNIQIKTTFGSLLFEFEKEDNSVKDTLIEAVKRDANLRGANLVGADLGDANLRGANLVDADLVGADLGDADLGGADLRGANLRGADLRDANLVGADLGGADLGDADLGGADLRGANLRGADLRDAKDAPFIPTYLPDGEFIAWKKLPNGLIAKLKILEDSKRSRAAGDKCRCDKCLVLEFQNVDGSISDEKTYTSHKYAVCTYTVGEVVRADKWDDNRWVECSHGIHFFIDRQSAVDY